MSTVEPVGGQKKWPPKSPTIWENMQPAVNQAIAKRLVNMTFQPSHVVSAGETLTGIAIDTYGDKGDRGNHINALAIAAVSGIRDPNLIQPGQAIRIPSVSTADLVAMAADLGQFLADKKISLDDIFGQ